MPADRASSPLKVTKATPDLGLSAVLLDELSTNVSSLCTDSRISNIAEVSCPIGVVDTVEVPMCSV